MIVSLKKLQKIAYKIAKTILPGDVILLYGELGVGKTTFCQRIVNVITEERAVSPTFSIYNTYQAKNFVLFHCDLYRISSQEEFFELGIENLQESVLLIEWPQIIEKIFPNALKIHLSDSEIETKRKMQITSKNIKWQKTINSIMIEDEFRNTGTHKSNQ